LHVMTCLAQELAQKYRGNIVVQVEPHNRLIRARSCEEITRGCG
jgi:hypothetical protein